MRQVAYALVTVTLVTILLPAAHPASRAPATVKLASEGVTLVITFDDRRKLKVTPDGTKLRAGTYWVKSLRFYKKDEKGHTWEMRSIGSLGGMKQLTVASGQEKIIDPGPPFQLRIWARQGKGAAANTVPISMSVLGQYDALYWPGAFRGRRKPPPPTFRISTYDGKTLARGRLKVEASGACRHTWLIPRGLKGNLKLEIKLATGPFEWGTMTRTIEIE